MKLFFFFLLFPVFCFSQTTHIKDGKIEYSGKVTVEGTSQTEIYNHAVDGLKSAIKDYSAFNEIKDSNIIRVSGEMKLSSTYNLRRTILYALQISVMNNGYEYSIDSVFMKEQVRGEKPKIISSKKLWKEMDEFGNVAIAAERVLNEIDMRFQKILAIVQSKTELKK